MGGLLAEGFGADGLAVGFDAVRSQSQCLAEFLQEEDFFAGGVDEGEVDGAGDGGEGDRCWNAGEAAACTDVYDSDGFISALFCFCFVCFGVFFCLRKPGSESTDGVPKVLFPKFFGFGDAGEVEAGVAVQDLFVEFLEESLLGWGGVPVEGVLPERGVSGELGGH